MKKPIILSIIATLAIGSVLTVAIGEQYTKFSSKFVKNFKDCDSYEETVSSEFENQKFTTHRKIYGWRNGSCLYEEVITSPKDQYKLLCTLNSMQVEDLYSAMKKRSRAVDKYELEVFVPQETKSGATKYKVVGTQTIKGNPAYIAWAKIQNNPYFCTPQKIK